MSDDDDPVAALYENVLDLKGQVEALERLVLALILFHNNPELIRRLIAQFPLEPGIGELEPFGRITDVLFDAPDRLRGKLNELLRLVGD